MVGHSWFVLSDISFSWLLIPSCSWLLILFLSWRNRNKYTCVQLWRLRIFFYSQRQFFIYMLVGFIFSLSKDLLPTYNIPGTMLDTGHWRMLYYDQYSNYFRVNCFRRWLCKRSHVLAKTDFAVCVVIFFTKLLLVRKWWWFALLTSLLMLGFCA